MKIRKEFLAVAVAVITLFVTAIGLCVRALSVPVAAFSGMDGEIRIALDAGHGGVDGGVSGRTTGVKESDLNLAIVLALKEELESTGFKVTLTRKTEAGLYDFATKGFKKRDMQKRKEIITACEPALVISVHQNYYPSPSTRGAQVFYKNSAPQNARLAKCVQSELNTLYKKQGAKARNTMAADYFMLNCYDCPSVLVECGFLSNRADEELLVTKAWQRRLAQSLTAGVMAYFSESLS